MVGGGWVGGLTCLLLCKLLVGLTCIAGRSDMIIAIWVDTVIAGWVGIVIARWVDMVIAMWGAMVIAL